ncbi:hypothetical protein NHX12_032980 [Muraenolepis orangiensis]|uniref:Uncharacterized protein n=1 Tax=Muraenolepis orangiensis TaxID=630683 RepID=A0A9Q0E1N1_9TELE|nr:hypothetical protein NHX12_032980 [Muraenolepis orangiensis]
MRGTHVPAGGERSQSGSPPAPTCLQEESALRAALLLLPRACRRRALSERLSSCSHVPAGGEPLSERLSSCSHVPAGGERSQSGSPPAPTCLQEESALRAALLLLPRACRRRALSEWLSSCSHVPAGGERSQSGSPPAPTCLQEESALRVALLLLLTDESLPQNSRLSFPQTY